MTFFETELMKMFGKNTALSDIRCTGNALLGRLTPETIAKVGFATSRVAGEYTSVRISVINPRIGEVDSQTINFCDVFNYPRKEYIYIWGPNDEQPRWSRFKPSQKNYEAINYAAQQYLEMFSEPVQGIGMTMSM